MTRTLAWLILASVLGACSADPTDPAERIRQNIAAMETALAAGDNSGFREHLAESFSGGGKGQRRVYKDDVKKMLAAYFYRYRNINILVTQVQVEVDLYQPQFASSSATVALSGGQRALPQSAGLYSVRGQWQDFDGTWKLVELEWE